MNLKVAAVNTLARIANGVLAVADWLPADRCPLCRERTRRLAAHWDVNHYGETL